MGGEVGKGGDKGRSNGGSSGGGGGEGKRHFTRALDGPAIILQETAVGSVRAGSENKSRRLYAAPGTGRQVGSGHFSGSRRE
jgi:hypothetical protein